MHSKVVNAAVRDEFHSKGFVKISRSDFSLDEESVKRMQNEFDKLFAGEFETGIYPDEIHWRQGISKENKTKEICNAWKASSEVAKIVCSDRLGSLACSLMGWKLSRIGQDDVLHKPPGANAVGFHQDGVYISDNFVPRENNCLTMWIALDDADEDNGALQYAPGSHLWASKDCASDVSSSSFHAADKDYLSPLRRAACEAGLEPEAVVNTIETVNVQAGEMIVHHQRIWHGSGPNLSSTRHRRALVAHLLNGEVRWRMDALPHYIYGRYYIRGETIPREDFFPITHSTDGVYGCRTRWLDVASKPVE